MDRNGEFHLENQPVIDFLKFLESAKPEIARDVIVDPRKDGQLWQTIDGQKTPTDLFKLALLAMQQSVNPTWAFTGRQKKTDRIDHPWREVIYFGGSKVPQMMNFNKLTEEEIERFCQQNRGVLGVCFPKVFLVSQPQTLEFIKNDTGEKERQDLELLCYETSPGALAKLAEKYSDLTPRAINQGLFEAVAVDFALVPYEMEF